MIRNHHELPLSGHLLSHINRHELYRHDRWIHLRSPNSILKVTWYSSHWVFIRSIGLSGSTSTNKFLNKLLQLQTKRSQEIFRNGTGAKVLVHTLWPVLPGHLGVSWGRNYSKMLINLCIFVWYIPNFDHFLTPFWWFWTMLFNRWNDTVVSPVLGWDW